MAESYVKKLKSCVQKQVEQNGSNWDLFLQTQHLLSDHTNNSTGVSPAELMIGAKLIQPVDTLIPHGLGHSEKQAHIFASDIWKDIHESNKIVKQQLKQAGRKDERPI